MNNKMTIETDLQTGDKILVTWSEVGVIRLRSPINEEGFAVDSSMAPPSSGLP